MKLRPHIYVNAAERIARQQSFSACYALNDAYIDAEKPQADFQAYFDAFEKHFRPNIRERRKQGIDGFSLHWWHSPDARNERVLALLFMSHIVKDLNLKR